MYIGQRNVMKQPCRGLEGKVIMTEITKREKARRGSVSYDMEYPDRPQAQRQLGLTTGFGDLPKWERHFVSPPPGMQKGQKQMGLCLLEHAAAVKPEI